MENKELKSRELHDDRLEQASGGSGVETHIHHLPLSDDELIIESSELTDDELAQASGGAFGDPVTCPECGKTMRNGFICTSCDMADGSVMCHQCGAQITREQPCKTCGKTWDQWVQETQWMRDSTPY